MTGLLLLAGLTGPARADDALAEAVCAVEDHPGRLHRLDEARAAAGSDRAAAGAALAGRSALDALHAADHDDAATCLAYLRDATSGDTGRRDAALQAARAGGALDADGHPTVAARPVDAAEQLAAPVDASTPRGRAVLHYGQLVAGITQCAVVTGGGGSAVNGVFISNPQSYRSSWAVMVGADRLLNPRAFVDWATATRQAGAVPAPDDVPRGPVQLMPGLMYHWDDDDRRDAESAIFRWNNWLLAQLDLTRDEVFGVELQAGASADFAPAAEDTRVSDWSRGGTAEAIKGLPPCP